MEADHKVQETVEADRIGSDHTAAAVPVEVVEGDGYSLGTAEAGRMVSEMTEDIAKTGRGRVAIGRREQEKNKCQCFAVLGWKVATGRASWQKVVAVAVGERHNPRRRDMLGSPTWFQKDLQS